MVETNGTYPAGTGLRLKLGLAEIDVYKRQEQRFELAGAEMTLQACAGLGKLWRIEIGHGFLGAPCAFHWTRSPDGVNA